MPIAPISPINSTQSNLLANALNGSTQSLSSAINAAIQATSQDVRTQLQQETNFLNTQQRNIAEDRAERFDLRDRAEFALQFGRQLENDGISNGVAVSKENRADEQFGFLRTDREELRDANLSTAERTGRSEQRLDDKLDQDTRLSNARITNETTRAETSRVNADASNQQQTRLTKAAEEDRAKRDAASTRDDNNRASLAQFLNGGVNLNKSNTDLVGDLNFLESFGDDPDARRAAGQIRQTLAERNGGGTSTKPDFTPLQLSQKRDQALELRAQLASGQRTSGGSTFDLTPQEMESMRRQAEILEQEVITGKLVRGSSLTPTPEPADPATRSARSFIDDALGLTPPKT